MVFILFFPVISNFHCTFESYRIQVGIHCHVCAKATIVAAQGRSTCRATLTHARTHAITISHCEKCTENWQRWQLNGTDCVCLVRSPEKWIRRNFISNIFGAVRCGSIWYPILSLFDSINACISQYEKPNSSQIAGNNMPFIASFRHSVCGAFRIRRDASHFARDAIEHAVTHFRLSIFFFWETKTRGRMKGMILCVVCIVPNPNNGRVLNSLTTTCCWVTFRKC